MSKVLEILIDDLARAAYDKVLKAREESKLRHQQLDSKRRKFKEDLEERERQAASLRNKSKSKKSPEQELREEIERLRKEGSRQVDEEMEYIMKKVKEDQENMGNDEKYRVKIKWKASKHDPDNGGYTSELLHKFLSKYGDITALIVSAKKKGSGLVEFKTLRAAVCKS